MNELNKKHEEEILRMKKKTRNGNAKTNKFTEGS